ncbi:hypothetical protein L3Q82_024364 [Scortum barcoo]|uniref:Uncharacterized protein n=1 Tax=Scortum barcoo TaxID=214431 RepID=A0ACB8WVI3_9TELE|nr:hypothetical protein L3Q82_024364 [Scortum barcoo]
MNPHSYSKMKHPGRPHQISLHLKSQPNYRRLTSVDISHCLLIHVCLMHVPSATSAAVLNSKKRSSSLTTSLQAHLASQQIHFQFNPPHTLHFGGSWKREIRSIKSALHTTLGSQSVTEEVLRTILLEVESIIDSKTLGYTSSDVTDPDPITPYMLLTARPDPSMPQVIYSDTELLSRHRWRQCQALPEQFWVHFIRNYLPS